MKEILKTLKTGMGLDDVEGKLGEPDVDLGSRMKVIGYYIDDKTMAVLDFGLQNEKKLSEIYIMAKSSKKFSDMTLEESKIYGTVF